MGGDSVENALTSGEPSPPDPATYGDVEGSDGDEGFPGARVVAAAMPPRNGLATIDRAGKDARAPGRHTRRPHAPPAPHGNPGEPAYPSGPSSNRTRSTSRLAALRCRAISLKGSESAMNSPSDSMRGSVATPASHWILEVAARVHLLGDVAREEFDEAYRILPVLRALDDRRARDVDVLAGAVLVEELDPDRARPVLLARTSSRSSPSCRRSRYWRARRRTPLRRWPWPGHGRSPGACGRDWPSPP